MTSPHPVLDPDETRRTVVAFTAVLGPVLAEAGRALLRFGAAVAQLRTSGALDTLSVPPGPYRDDRPRWQSPYGPPRRTR